MAQIQQVARLLRVGGGLALAGGGIVFIGGECLYNVDGGERVVIFDRFRGILPEESAGVEKTSSFPLIF